MPSFFRCFLSAGSPASSPARSRVVEAICIRLCQRHPHARREVCEGRPRYTSRWKLILQDYRVRARVMNSLELLESTNLQLFTINERTLMAWHKNTTRVQEVSMLIQGLCPPAPTMCATTPLPLALVLPSSPGPSNHPALEFEEPEDTTGQATKRFVQPQEVVASKTSRTTEWRRRKKAAAAASSSLSSSTGR